jgi:hypothetical protein
MRYRLVYDVLNDGFPWLGVFFTSVPLLIAIGCLLELAERVRGKPPVPMPVPRVFGRIPLGAAPLPFLILFILLFGFGALFFALLTHRAFVQERECQEWVRSGKYQVAEGTITDYHFRKGGSSFRIEGVPFDLLNRSVGFTGRFNVPCDPQGELKDGLRVRLAHRDGFILRVEIDSGQGGLADGLGN